MFDILVLIQIQAGKVFFCCYRVTVCFLATASASKYPNIQNKDYSLLTVAMINERPYPLADLACRHARLRGPA